MNPFLILIILFLLAGIPDGWVQKQQLGYHLEVNPEGAKQELRYHLHLGAQKEEPDKEEETIIEKEEEKEILPLFK